MVMHNSYQHFGSFLSTTETGFFPGKTYNNCFYRLGNFQLERIIVFYRHRNFPFEKIIDFYGHRNFPLEITNLAKTFCVSLPMWVNRLTAGEKFLSRVSATNKSCKHIGGQRQIKTAVKIQRRH